jgi:acetyl esterase/lipase
MKLATLFFAVTLTMGAWSCAQPTMDADSVEPASVAPAVNPEAAVLLWPDGNPGGWKAEHPEEQVLGNGVLRIDHVEQPSLQYFPPTAGLESSPVAVVVCPGGGYNILAMNKEGTDIAQFLAQRGIHAFALKYRLPNVGELRYRPALEDTQRALQMVRDRGIELGFNSVGIMGFSAGAHLSATTAAQARPLVDFVGLVYPAYFFKSKDGEELVDELAPGENPAPAFMAHALNDPYSARHSVVYAEALAARGVAAEVHLYARGGHGFGLTQAGKLPVGDWADHLVTWLRRQAVAD